MSEVGGRLAAQWQRVRMLHAPVVMVLAGKPRVVCELDWTSGGKRREWPCATAMVVYTIAEVEKVFATTGTEGPP